MYENVRPQMCVNATKDLLGKPLFRNYMHEGLDTDWLQAWEESPLSEFLYNDHSLDPIPKESENIAQSDDQQPHTPKDNTEDSHKLEYADDSDAWSEDGEENLSGETDTMMFPTFTDEYDGQQVVSIAPSEGNVPTNTVARYFHTCKKKGKRQCRFNFPLPPSCSTKLLEPLVSSPGENDDEFQKATENWAHIQTFMEEICSTPNIIFTEFLQHLKMSEEDYINAIKSLLKDAKILFKRDPCKQRDSEGLGSKP
ncbi:hypothetical protein MAR_015572 [Mya arenaria]|uniref:Uncharacterized protein n=1 Tax=Mya arenaria TaxID=6604 RepID=A0ABY7FHE3_MYAAR|nr:hypothetical protein MAR_015572 [Mya arenaria]